MTVKCQPKTLSFKGVWLQQSVSQPASRQRRAAQPERSGDGFRPLPFCCMQKKTRCRDAAMPRGRVTGAAPRTVPTPAFPCPRALLMTVRKELCLPFLSARGLVTDDRRRESKVVSWLRGQREGPTADRREFSCLARLEISSCRLARRDGGRTRSIFIRGFFSCCSRYLSSGLLLGVGWLTAPLVLGADLPDLHILLIRLANLQDFLILACNR